MTAVLSRPYPSLAELSDQLRSLGSNADEVADTLFAEGIRGYPGSSIACPVATWLCQRYPDVQWLVSGTTIATFGDQEWSVNNPEAIATFVDEFDDGRYADLYPDSYDHSTYLDGV